MPKEVEGYIRSLGFSNIHIRATEQQMAKNHDLARENYCTPREITRLMEWFYEHHEDDEYLDFIWNTMLECRTGIERLPSLTSEGDRIVHKTGTGFANENGSMDRNDVGVIIRADTATTIVSVFVPYSNDESDVADILRASGL